MEPEEYKARVEYLRRLRLSDDDLNKLKIVRNDCIPYSGDKKQNFIKSTKKSYQIVQQERANGLIDVLQLKYGGKWYDVPLILELEDLLKKAHTLNYGEDNGETTKVGFQSFY